MTSPPLLTGSSIKSPVLTPSSPVLGLAADRGRREGRRSKQPRRRLSLRLPLVSVLEREEPTWAVWTTAWFAEWSKKMEWSWRKYPPSRENALRWTCRLGGRDDQTSPRGAGGGFGVGGGDLRPRLPEAHDARVHRPETNGRLIANEIRCGRRRLPLTGSIGTHRH